MNSPGEVLEGAGSALQLQFLGQLMDMLLVAVLIAAGRYLLNVPLASTLALLNLSRSLERWPAQYRPC